jgi:hypothetical protein
MGHNDNFFDTSQIPKAIWRMPIRRVFADKTMRIDTICTLFSSSDAPPEYYIEKQLLDVPGATPSYAVGQEKMKIRQIMSLGLPCAELFSRDVTAVKKEEESRILRTWYAGPSLEQLLTQDLRFDEYSSLIHAYLVVLSQYAKSGVFPIDTAPRNVCFERTQITAGAVNIKTCKLIDHRHTILKGSAAASPWPFLRLEKSSAPEVAALLADDQRIPIKQIAPNRPVTFWWDLASLPAEEQSQLLENINSPFLGGAVDTGALNIDAALQSIAAFEICKLRTGAASRRPHPSAQKFLKSFTHVLTKMNSEHPNQRYKNIDEAAQMWLANCQPLSKTLTQIYLKSPGNEPVEGASQPETQPPEAYRPTSDDRIVEIDATSWFRWSFAELIAGTKQKLKLPQSWGSLSKPRVYAYTILMITAVVCSFFVSIVVELKPESITRAREFESIRPLVAELSKSIGAEVDSEIIRTLIRLQKQSKDRETTDYIEKILNEHWKSTIRRASLAYSNNSETSEAERRNVDFEIETWSIAGYTQALTFTRRLSKNF